ncbi:hypothetical protein EK21DRAFT_83219 [Setomelanomma holmii]|uniref:Kinesin light chain n=1 Tax=Setomelanomma holmii TaxID=210430 RepID=A0A9P4LEV0_9PLEO|nr:hypothetical protein EK21DRAFT_83219 [Setomelanomma holmii]
MDAVHTLGVLHVDHGRPDKVKEMYGWALEGKEKALGRDHTSILGTVKNLSLLDADQGKLDKAKEIHGRALEGYKKRFGSDHPHCHSHCRALATLRDGVETQ